MEQVPGVLPHASGIQINVEKHGFSKTTREAQAVLRNNNIFLLFPYKSLHSLILIQKDAVQE